ncbi:hypothetical protein A3H03_03455 [Candidatus Kuenenbacteria bacterium RIFCSPLOWO2_12_FULL_42_13]|uniref:Peptidase S8/S53 domain-containing protein n=1 Tax=Candidatus Kuenenbacteria bacterium RIFCSPLOWO2_12_FULL_42_13 TaxID=1798565 RepID=A0A1F6G280_9BACT|nr:MAG: hypothetical protein A3H03_03455 [Candidatus Kuenenbacteria bacterium RIFCSPLOWO2_12_FULL_42_13]
MPFLRKKIIIYFSLLASLFLLIGDDVFVLAKETPAVAPHVNDQVLIKLKNSDSIYQINLRGEPLTDFIKNNRQNSLVAYIEPNYIYQSSLDPNDTFYPQQLVYLSSIKVPLAWNYTTGDSGVVVAVIDTGVYINHPDLINNIWHNLKEIPGNRLDDDNNGYIDDYTGWDFVSGDSDPNPKFIGDYSFLGMNHGTIITGIIAAEGNNGVGITGLNWRAKIMPLRALNGAGVGNTLDVAKAIDYARENGAKIINLSFVGEGESQTLKAAIGRAYQAGILVVAAAGNEVNQGIDMTGKPQYPVCHDGDAPGDNWVIGVASVDNADQLASFSNYGKCIDIIAPGAGIFSTLFQENYHSQYDKEYGGLWSGTSISAPQVAGALALLKALKPELSLLEMRDLLLNNTDNIDRQNPAYPGKLGRGKLNVLKVITAAKNTLSQTEYKTDKIIVAPGVGGGPQIRTFYEGQPYSQFFAFDKNKRLGANVASRDLNNDGQEEIVASAEKGEEPWVEIFDIKGEYKTKFLAYDKGMKQGVKVGVGDIDNDGQKEIIAVPQAGYQPLVRIYSQTGKFLGEFLAFNKFFTGGLNISIGDVNDDNFGEIIIGGGPGSQSYVRIFNYHGQLISQFLAYNNFFGGINVAFGDLDGDGNSEIVTAPMGKLTSQIKVFSAKGLSKSNFYAYDKKFLGGVSVAVGDINGDGIDEIITGPGRSGGPHVKIFNMSGKLLSQFMAYQSTFKGGIKVSSGK